LSKTRSQACGALVRFSAAPSITERLHERPHGTSSCRASARLAGPPGYGRRTSSRTSRAHKAIGVPIRRMPTGTKKTARINKRASSRRPPMMPMSDVRRTPRVDTLPAADIACGRALDTVPSAIVARVCINPRLAADRPRRACPETPRAKTRPCVRVSVASRRVYEFVRGDGACAFGSSGTERDRRFVQTYRHRIVVRSDPAVPFRTRARSLSPSRPTQEAKLHPVILLVN
jgi:hypothetical protein